MQLCYFYVSALSKQCDEPKRGNSGFLKASKWDFSCQLHNIEGQKYPQNMVFKQKEPYFRCNCCTRTDPASRRRYTWMAPIKPTMASWCAHWNVTNLHSYFRFVQRFWKGKFDLDDSTWDWVLLFPTGLPLCPTQLSAHGQHKSHIVCSG